MKPWKQIRDEIFTPKEQAMHDAEAKRIIAELPLAQLRKAREVTQKQIAAFMSVGQPQITRIEKQADMYVSTLRHYIEAMGGELEVRARFPEGEVVINQFDEPELAATDEFASAEPADLTHDH
ncbi:MAG TPA: XRE family transcriptional regulator [Oscillatoriaceae cyanobacterium]